MKRSQRIEAYSSPITIYSRPLWRDPRSPNVWTCHRKGSVRPMTKISSCTTYALAYKQLIELLLSMKYEPFEPPHTLNNSQHKPSMYGSEYVLAVIDRYDNAGR